MKQDYEFIKKILTTMIDADQPALTSSQIYTLVFGEGWNDDHMHKLYGHMQILFDGECITKTGFLYEITIQSSEIEQTKRHHLDIGFVVKKECHNSPLSITPSIDLIRLTKNGYDLLISLENSKVMEEVKKSGGKIAIESLIGIATSLGTVALTKIAGM